MTDDIGAERLQTIPQFRDIIAFWQQKRNELGGALPSRAELKPAELVSFLRWTFLAESRGPEDLTVVLSATIIDEKLGHNLGGTNMYGFYEQAAKPMYQQFFAPILAGEKGGFSDRIIQGNRNEMAQYEVLYLPLRTRAGDPGAVIGTVHWTPRDELGHAEDLAAKRFSRINDLSYVDLERFDLTPFPV
ncbi:PAS domain-containing protein [Kordiimonas marina]|uniref:PAS domain-containing protein n=1 Tax=Kordiimonas marina TaxID=2872312 RepID=UPI001FF2E91B|nr:PAS domain-containing protein [Kordiimonas marina]